MTSARLRRTRALLRWVFIHGRRPTRAELKRALAILFGVALVNTALQARGAYDRLDWADLDRIQQTSRPTGPGSVAVVLIDDEDYEALFDGRSPLAPRGVVELVAAICRFRPRVVGVDLVTADWAPDFYESTAAPRLDGCPIVWITDAIEPRASRGKGARDRAPLQLGKVLGRSTGPTGPCTAVPVFEPDGDGVIRRYRATYPAVYDQGSPGGPVAFPTFVAALARRANSSDCPRAITLSAHDTVSSLQIRFTSDDSIPRFPARLLMTASSQGNERLERTIASRITDMVVVVGGEYRHSRDVHRTTIGSLPGSALVANAVYTEMQAPIRNVHWSRSLAIDVVVGLVLLLGLMASGLRWLWATAAAVVLSAAAALTISWHLHDYLGVFLGVLGGLMGVVLAELTSVMWEPFRDMWRGWLREYPAPDRPQLPPVAPPPTSAIAYSPPDPGAEPAQLAALSATSTEEPNP